jgi:hypothetical protein
MWSARPTTQKKSSSLASDGCPTAARHPRSRRASSSAGSCSSDASLSRRRSGLWANLAGAWCWRRERLVTTSCVATRATTPWRISTFGRPRVIWSATALRPSMMCSRPPGAQRRLAVAALSARHTRCLRRTTAARALARGPVVRAYIRTTYGQKSVVSTRPTAKGVHEIDWCHEFYPVKRLRVRPPSRPPPCRSALTSCLLALRRRSPCWSSSRAPRSSFCCSRRRSKVGAAPVDSLASARRLTRRAIGYITVSIALPDSAPLTAPTDTAKALSVNVRARRPATPHRQPTRAPGARARRGAGACLQQGRVPG